MFSGKRKSAFLEIEKSENREQYIPLLCLDYAESIWFSALRRKKERNPARKLLQSLTTPVQEDTLRHTALHFVWWSKFSLRLAELAKAASDFPLAPFWKEIVLLAFYKTGNGGGTCYNYGLLPISTVLNHIQEKNPYLADLSDFFLQDIPDELALLNTRIINITDCPLTKMTFKKWRNLFVKQIIIRPNIPYRAMRVLRRTFPEWDNAEILSQADYLLKFAEERKSVESQEAQKFGLYALNLLRLIPADYRKHTYYQKRRQAYVSAGNERMAEFCSIHF